LAVASGRRGNGLALICCCGRKIPGAREIFFSGCLWKDFAKRSTCPASSFEFRRKKAPDDAGALGLEAKAQYFAIGPSK
jgi:hypothetical protein